MREIWLGFVGVLVLAALSPAGAANGTTPVLIADTNSALAVTPDDRILGNPDAAITIVEYASLNCPHCAHFAHDVLPKLKEKWIDSGKAKLVLRDFPLDEQALRAAMVARCAPRERYYGFVDAFMEAQPRWVGSSDYRTVLAQLSKTGGMSEKRFDTCITDSALEDQIAKSRLVADQQLGVTATPTFFVNGTRFEGEPSLGAFERVLSGASAKS
ncbi:MAG: DsbA family protein [Alphaproteobacteria bacterium]|nr:DsbA family protein [Alphaproteobacteria bacterium]